MPSWQAPARAPALRRPDRCPRLRPLRRSDAPDKRPRRLLRRDRLFAHPPWRARPVRWRRARAELPRQGMRALPMASPASCGPCPGTHATGQVYLPADILKDPMASPARTSSPGRGEAPAFSARRPTFGPWRADISRLSRQPAHDHRARRACPAFLPTGIGRTLASPMMERPGYDPLNTVIALPRWRRLVAAVAGDRGGAF